MSFADTKARFLKKRGDPCTIIRPTGNILTTGRILAVKRKTDFFSINFLREGVFTVDSGVLHGDLVQNNVTGEQFFVMAVQNKTVSGEPNSIDSELYMVNQTGLQVLRYQEDGDGYGNPVVSWGEIGNSILANVQHLTGNEQFYAGVLLPNAVLRVTIQADAADVHLDDRVPIGGSNYKVIDVDVTISPGLLVMQMERDMR